MSETLLEEKVFKDPVHKYIYVKDKVIWDLINTKEFQRLRRIKQLGTSFFTFHGSEHSRFSHSLGVYEITRRITSSFERNEYPDWSRENRLLSLCAALLHDIGHGPFSHTFEHAFGTDHEEWSCRIILEETEVNQVLRRMSPDFPQMVADVICKTYPHSMLVGLISSQMDADRMDYLLRDAYYTGVHYGTFDLERILRVLRPYEGKIVVKESGMHAVEDYLMSRYQMYWQVYFHPVTKSAEILLKKIFKRAKHLFHQQYPFQYMPYPMESLFNQNLSLEDYLFLDETVIHAAIKHWMYEQDAILSDLSRRFENRQLFKYVRFRSEDKDKVEELRYRISEAGIDPDYYTEVHYPTDSPYNFYQPGEESIQPIYLINERDQLLEISTQSPFIHSIHGLHKQDNHLYYPDQIGEGDEALRREIRERLQSIQECE